MEPTSKLNGRVPKRSGRADLDDQQTRKRGKYTQVACNECKRRKLKCSGEETCRRCARHGTLCIYTPHVLHRNGIEHRSSSDRAAIKFKEIDDKMEAFQREIRVLSTQFQVLQRSHPPLAQGYGRTDTDPQNAKRFPGLPGSPSYIGPTSAEFGLNVSNRTQDRQVEDPEESDDGSEFAGGMLNSGSPTTPPAPVPSYPPRPLLPHLPATPSLAFCSQNPLLAITDQEALRLVDVYEEAVGVIYPFIDLESIRVYVADFFPGRCVARAFPAHGKDLDKTEQDWFFARDVEVLKIILATALLAETHGRSEIGAQLADSVLDSFAPRVKVFEVDMKELMILMLLSIYHSYRDDAVIAWRMIGLSARAAMELGLHRWDTWLKTGGIFPGELQRSWAIKLFWCIYVLDRKFSFETGMPFALQDSDMDTNLPEPGEMTPYLSCMISYARLGSKIWNLVVGWSSSARAVTAENCTYLNYQVQQWARSIPAELQLSQEWERLPISKPNSIRLTLQVILRLQANQLRILVHKQNLLSNETIEDNLTGATTALEAAKDTIQTLDSFSRISHVYFDRPQPFNHFLFSALAALFLAVFHAPTRFSHLSQSEFYRAIEMVKRSPARARTSRRLQKIIKNLKHIRCQLDPPRRPANNNNSNSISPQPVVHPSITLAGTNTLTNPAGMQMPQRPQYSNSHPPVSLSTAFPPSLASASFPPPPLPSPCNLVDDLNSCDDLTSFFELAGVCFMEPRHRHLLHPVSSISTSSEPSGGEDVPPHVATSNNNANAFNAVDAFHAEDETLTRLMVGLL